MKIIRNKTERDLTLLTILSDCFRNNGRRKRVDGTIFLFFSESWFYRALCSNQYISMPGGFFLCSGLLVTWTIVAQFYSLWLLFWQPVFCIPLPCCCCFFMLILEEGIQYPTLSHSSVRNPRSSLYNIYTFLVVGLIPIISCLFLLLLFLLPSSSSWVFKELFCVIYCKKWQSFNLKNFFRYCLTIGFDLWINVGRTEPVKEYLFSSSMCSS